MSFKTTSFETQALSLGQLQNIAGGSLVSGGATPIATTGYSFLLGDGTIVPNTGWLPVFPG